MAREISRATYLQCLGLLTAAQRGTLSGAPAAVAVREILGSDNPLIDYTVEELVERPEIPSLEVARALDRTLAAIGIEVEGDIGQWRRATNADISRAVSEVLHTRTLTPESDHASEATDEGDTPA